MLIFVP